MTQSLKHICQITCVATLAIIVMSESGCTHPKAVGKTSKLAGKPIQENIVEVSAPFEFEKALVTDTLPAGRYMPEAEDEEGVYYHATKPIILNGMFGPQPSGGGLYIKKTQPPQAYEYLDNPRGDPPRYRLPDTFHYRFVSAEKKEKVWIESAAHLRSGTPEGDYDAKLIREINSRFYENMEDFPKHPVGYAKAEFDLLANGHIENLRITEQSKQITVQQKESCLKAIQESAPFSNFPSESKATWGPKRHIRITFEFEN